MKTTVVPAQITTVEDRIAGNLTFMQIILLVFSLIIGTAFYALISPKLHISVLKAVLIVFQFAILGSLSIRWGGKILAEWLIIYLRYSLRPRVYTFSKSDLSGRDVILPEFKRTQKKYSPESVKTVNKEKHSSINENIATDSLLDNPNMTMSVKPGKKGGLDVVLREL